ncbi:MAG TPA: hypothetical protein VHO24_13385 [Opitutaceae bacterium]|nr:hypothetical protein [Opitutaceae bacterium]
MNPMRGAIGGLLVLAATAACCGEELFDRIESALSFSALEHQLRARVSGTIDLEAYHVQHPSPGLVYSARDTLLNPRLSLFLDAQYGAGIYAFAQARVDRGFDPSEAGGRVRLDEYAVRFTARGGVFNFQVGKFATVVGNWVPRHGSWENPFVTAPLPYENLTGVWDIAAPRSNVQLLNWAHVRPNGLPGAEFTEKRLRSPVIWGPSYTLGGTVFGEIGKWKYAVELKNANLSSHPEIWGSTEDHWRHPTLSGRLGYRPNPTWNFGVSGSSGVYLRPHVSPTFQPGYNLGDHRQTVVAGDLSFAWRHVQVWGEIYQARFEMPNVGDADTVAYYTEVKYKFTPQFFGSLRWNQQRFGTIPNGPVETRWGRNTWRIDVGPAYRFTPHLQVKLQYSLQRQNDAPRNYSHLFASQFVLRF